MSGATLLQWESTNCIVILENTSFGGDALCVIRPGRYTTVTFGLSDRNKELDFYLVKNLDGHRMELSCSNCEFLKIVI